MPPESRPGAESRRPLRIGIDCSQGLTLRSVLHGEALVPHLVAGLLALGEPVKVVLIVPPRDRGRAAVVRRGGGRVKCLFRRPPGGGAGKQPPAVRLRRGWAALARAVGKIRERARRPAGRAAALALGVFLVPMLLLLWPPYALYRLVLSLARGLFWPARLLLRIARRRWGAGARPCPDGGDCHAPPERPAAPPPVVHGPQPYAEDLLPLMNRAACDVWLLPARGHYPLVPFPTVVLLDGRPPIPLPRHVDEAPLWAWVRGPRGKGRPPAGLPLDPDRVRVLDGATAKERAGAWLAVFREAVRWSAWRNSLDGKMLAPWPPLQAVPAQPRERLDVFLFLQTGYAGGVWETTKELMQDLAALNRARGRLALTLAVHDLQDDTRALERLRPEVTLKRVRMNPLLRSEAVRMFGGTPPWLAVRPEKEFCFLSGAAFTALRADAWLALVDRFPLPLLPARPYGVVVYDMIQSYAPEGFPPTFFTDMAVGMTPAVRAADRVLVTSPQTRDDAIRGYGLDPAKVSLVPLACNPARRFDHLTPVPVPRLREPFILNVAGRGRHKGAEVMLRGYARLKARLGKRTPHLVFCGYGTDEFAPRYKGPVRTLAHSRAMRRLVRELGLVQGRDVTFLGFRSDAELLDLYRRCSVVVNAALYDNGTFTVLEGAYFGRPAVSSRYPAAEFISERFSVPTEFFPCGDPDGLADAVLRALRKGPDGPAEVERTRARFAEPEFSSRRYAERIYDVLVSLAEHGRRTRPLETWQGYAAWAPPAA